MALHETLLLFYTNNNNYNVKFKIYIMKTVKKNESKFEKEFFMLTKLQLQSIRGGNSSDTPVKDQDLD
jgi:hypothetical protein